MNYGAGYSVRAPGLYRSVGVGPDHSSTQSGSTPHGAATTPERRLDSMTPAERMRAVRAALNEEERKRISREQSRKYYAAEHRAGTRSIAELSTPLTPSAPRR